MPYTTQRLAFGLTLAGGLLIATGAVWISAILVALPGFSMGPMGGMMVSGGGFGMTSGGAYVGMMLGAGIVGGALVLLGAWMLRGNQPSPAAGVIVLVGAAMSLLAMGGFMIGALLAGAGGIVALVETGGTQPERAQT